MHQGASAAVPHSAERVLPPGAASGAPPSLPTASQDCETTTREECAEVPYEVCAQVPRRACQVGGGRCTWVLGAGGTEAEVLQQAGAELPPGGEEGVLRPAEEGVRHPVRGGLLVQGLQPAGARRRRLEGPRGAQGGLLVILAIYW